MTTTDPKLIERVKAAMRDSQQDFPGQVWMHPFDAQMECMAAAAINEAVQNERAGIVAWLRAIEIGSISHRRMYQAVAHAIERGAHLPSPPAIEAHKESGALRNSGPPLPSPNLPKPPPGREIA